MMVQYKATIIAGLLEYGEHDEHDPFMNKSGL